MAILWKGKHKIHDFPVQNWSWVRLLCRRNQSLLHSPQSARIEPIINPAAHTVNAHPIPHKAHLRQVSQLRSLPPQLIKDAAVETLLLLTAAAQFSQVWIIQTGPVLREGLGTVSLDLPARKPRFESKSNMQEWERTVQKTAAMQELQLFSLEIAQRYSCLKRYSD